MAMLPRRCRCHAILFFALPCRYDITLLFHYACQRAIADLPFCLRYGRALLDSPSLPADMLPGVTLHTC